MVARQEIRRRWYYDRLFEGAVEPAGAHHPDLAGFEVRIESRIDWVSTSAAEDNGESRVAAPPRRSELVKIFDGNDELLIEPRQIVVVGAPTAKLRSNLELKGFEIRGDLGRDVTERLIPVIQDQTLRAEIGRLVGGLQVWSQSPEVPAEESARTIVEIVREHGENGAVRPVYGFVTNQTTMPSSDPERIAYVAEPNTADPSGTGTTVCVFDTGVNETCVWEGRLVRRGIVDDDQLLVTGIDGNPYLGTAAGHGSFVGGLLLQVVPSATIAVRRVADSNGLVSEFAVVSELVDLLIEGAAPDVLLMPFGGYALNVGTFGENKASRTSDQWAVPALLGLGLAIVAILWPNLVMVASAGNDSSTDPMFPAGFTTYHQGFEKELASRMVAVAALDDAGYLAEFSNYGEWVNASALGVRLHAAYVDGKEDPDKDRDRQPETFVAPSFARWSGTSFAAPLVAGAVARRLWDLRAVAGTPTAMTAWQSLRDSSGMPRDRLAGHQIVVEGVAHG